MVGAIDIAIVIAAAAFGGPSSATPSELEPTFDGPPGHAHEHGPAHPIDAIVGGGVAKGGPQLQVPWMCGQTEYCTQGHNGGSHTGLSSWAWDFALQDGEEIWAASSGTVTHLKMDSNSGGCDQAFSGQANYITIDHGDGTSIVYLHMRGGSSPLSVGEEVEVGDLVARVGETGWACGAHLHMQVMQTCGSYYCQSIPATFVDYGDPVPSTTYAGTNCPSCAIEIDGTVTTIDDEDAGCFARETTAWWSTYEGQSDHHFYTLATDAAAADSNATWRFGVAVPGDYAVEVFVPASADTTNARYQIMHADGTTEVAIDQSTQKDWQSLGTFAFMGTGSEGIALGDNTGESLDLARRIGYDAVRLTFVPAAGDDTGDDPTTSGDDSAATDDAGDADTGDDGRATTLGDPTAPDGDGGDSDDGATGSLPPGYGGDAQDGGCACRSTPTPDRGGVAWTLFVLALILRFPRARGRDRG